MKPIVSDPLLETLQTAACRYPTMRLGQLLLFAAGLVGEETEASLENIRDADLQQALAEHLGETADMPTSLSPLVRHLEEAWMQSGRPLGAFVHALMMDRAHRLYDVEDDLFQQFLQDSV